jgi:LuxR family transcriptional regulator, maltose regulon positive regulatory protein
LEQGDITAAEAWEQHLPDDALRPKLPYRERQSYAEESFSVFLHDIIGITRGRLRLAQDRPEEAAQIFVETGENAAVQERFSVQLECKIRTAAAYQACGKTAQAQECLTFALRRARPEGYVRLFLEAGPVLIPLLREAAERGIETDYARMLLAAFGEAGNQTPAAGARLAARKLPPSELADPLTGREIEVLSLVAAGLSNQDIADRLFLSVGTVKRHVHNIFGKLDAGGRVEAIARARTLGLLDDA